MIFSVNFILISIVAVILSILTLFIVGIFNSRLEELLATQMIFPIVVCLFVIVLVLLYYGFVKIYNAFNSGKNEENKANKIDSTGGEGNNSDLYLREKKNTCDLREYQIENHEKEIVWYGKCILRQNSIQSIELYSSKPNVELILQVIRSPDGVKFSVNDKKTAIGYLIIENNGLIFNDLDMQKMVAIFEDEINEEEEDVNIVYMIATLTPAPSCSRKTKQFSIRGKSNGILGKYYVSLQNIDLTPDINNEFDRRVAIVAAIFLDVQF